MNEEKREHFGEYLRRQREIRGFSLEEISEQTKISLRALKAIEAEDWESLPAEIYIRGFIRCYCETIGLDPNEALLRFEEAYAPYKREQRERHFTEEDLTPSKRNPYWWPIVLVLLILAGVLGYLLFSHHKASTISAPKTSSEVKVSPSKEPPVQPQGPKISPPSTSQNSTETEKQP